jgi:hypothetical protein
MKRDELPEIVDGFGRMQETAFGLDALLAHVKGKLGKGKADDVYDVAATSDYLFESWEKPAKEIFMPRRTFFQGAQFRVTPTDKEVEGGFLVPGYRFFPFASREVFPADVRLVLPDFSAATTRHVTLPTPLAMNHLKFFGPKHAMEYLVLDREANSDVLVPPFTSEVEMTAFDLCDYFDSCGFLPGDSLMLTVLDWLHGVFSVAHAPVAADPADLATVREWVDLMGEAFCDVLDELGTDEDCYEQLAHMLLFAEEFSEHGSPMRNPPLSLASFFATQKDIAVKLVEDRAIFWDADDDPQAGGLAELESGLDVFFRQLGLSISESDAEAYMRDALFRGKHNPDAVLARVAVGKALFFRSAEDQEEFHGRWCELWDDVRALYLPGRDPYGEIRTDFLALNDLCLAVLHRLDDPPENRLKTPELQKFDQMSAMIASSLALMNMEDPVGVSVDHFREMLDVLAPSVESLLVRLREG